jgi:hypothetical protein
MLKLLNSQFRLGFGDENIKIINNFETNATNVIKYSYLIPINFFDSWGYNSILSRGLVIIYMRNYTFSVYFPTKFILKIDLLLNLL